MSVAQGTTIDAVRRKYEDQLMSLPNVTGVGIGEKNGKPVIKVFVTRRVPESSLRPDEMIPGALEGYETDVEEVGDLTAQPRVPTVPDPGRKFRDGILK